jgi:hypothetical protein
VSSGRWLAIHRTLDGVMHKQCCACKAWLPLTAEHYAPKGERYFNGRCRPCNSIYQAAHWAGYGRKHYSPVEERARKARRKTKAVRMLETCWKAAA